MKDSTSRLRCKPGDTAIIVSTGKLVTVIRPYMHGERVSGTDWVNSDGELHPAWVVESLGAPIQNYGRITNLPWGELMVVVREDRCLLPLRNELGEDEMLRITGKPKDAEKPVDVNRILTQTRD